MPSLQKVCTVYFDVDPTKATAGDKLTMGFFLNRVLVSMDPNLVKRWVPGKSTHMDYFGETYPFEIAFSLNLLSMFSDPANVIHNAGLLDDEGNLLPRGTPLQPPKKRRRKKTQTKSSAWDIEQDYYEHIEKVKLAMAQPGFKDRMALWDKLVCSE